MTAIIGPCCLDTGTNGFQGEYLDAKVQNSQHDFTAHVHLGSHQVLERCGTGHLRQQQPQVEHIAR